MNANTPSVPQDLLKRVSRSFYFSLWLLPAPVRAQISLAYLLARATDTIADTGLVLVAERLGALEALRERILARSAQPVAFTALAAANHGNPAERELLERAETLVGVLEGLTEADQKLIRQVLDTITGGQMLDLQRFAGAAAGEVKALQTAVDLEDYTYRVAGCVGEFWTRMCAAHLAPAPVKPLEQLVADGVRFGQGLQLVNILRDLPRDLRQGRCYLPAEELREAGLSPADLLIPSNEGRLRPVYDPWVDQANQWLMTGWDYTVALPRPWRRVRLACALPILIGMKTLAKLQNQAILNPDLRIKVSRPELRGIVLRALIWYPWQKQWQRLPSLLGMQAGP